MTVRVLLVLTLIAWVAEGQTANENPNKGAWYENAVIYQIYPRSFQDSNGDGIGDLRGIIQNIEYLKSLFIDAVWLNPIYPSPNKDYGYDITDMKAIDPTLGTMDDFNELVNTLKNNSIGVVLDFVPNHTSDQHKWFNLSASGNETYKDYYVWLPPLSNDLMNKSLQPPNNWTSCNNGSMWEYHSGRKEFYLHQFTKYQPDLNYYHPAVVNEMEDVLKFWLDKGVWGFRMDAVFALTEDQSWRDEPYQGGPPNAYSSYKHTMTAELPKTFEILRRFRKVLDEYPNPNNIKRIMMTESYNDNYNEIRKYYGTETEPISTFPFNFFWITKGKLNTNAKQWADLINDWYKNVMPGTWAQPNFVLGNHDQHRIASRLSPEHTDLMNILQLMLKGTAVAYFGDEIGLLDSHVRRDEGKDPVALNGNDADFYALTRDPERAPMPWNDTTNGGFTTNQTAWLPLATQYWKANVKAQRYVNASHLSVYQNMMILRTVHLNHMSKAPNDVFALGNVLVVARSQMDSPTVIAVLNMANLQETVNLKQNRPTLPRTLNIAVKSSNYEMIEQSLNKVSDIVLSSEIVLPPLCGLVLTTF